VCTRSVIQQHGRVSGHLYETPVVAVATDDGFMIALVYGRHSDGLENVLASGSASIVHEGRAYPGRPDSNVAFTP
jgi:hypothetical protein